MIRFLKRGMEEQGEEKRGEEKIEAYIKIMVEILIG